MLEEGDRLTELSVLKERLELELQVIEDAEQNGEDFDEANKIEIEAELDDINLESNSITQTLDILEQNLEFIQGKMNVAQQEVKSFDMDSI